MRGPYGVDENTAKRNRHKETGRETGVIELYRMQEAHSRKRCRSDDRGRGYYFLIAALEYPWWCWTELRNILL